MIDRFILQPLDYSGAGEAGSPWPCIWRCEPVHTYTLTSAKRAAACLLAEEDNQAVAILDTAATPSQPYLWLLSFQQRDRPAHPLEDADFCATLIMHLFDQHRAMQQRLALAREG